MAKHNAKTKTTAVDFAILLTETQIENLSDVLKYLLAEGKIAHKKNSYYLK